MKLKYKLILTALFFGVAFLNIQAQSELIVEWADGNGDVQVNALYDAITNDTDRPEDRVYVLRAGGYYWNSERIDNDGWHLRIIGEEPDPNDEFKGPAVIQTAPRDDNSTTDGIIRGKGDITIKNVWITGAHTVTGTQTTYQPFQIDAANSTFIADNCIFDRSNFAMIAFSNSGNDITIKNCKFRNLIGRPSSQQWEGRGISIWADQKNVVIENNTFFNLGMTAIQIESGAAEYVRIVHNTFVNVGRIITQVGWWREAYVADNLLVNGFWHGEGHNDVITTGRDPRLTHSGYFFINALPGMYGPEEGRRIYIGHMAAYTAQTLKDYYADSIAVPTFIDPVTAEDFVALYPNMVVGDTIWANPGMITETTENYPNMIQNIEELRANISPAKDWMWSLPEYEGVECYECISWPLPENFAYTNETLQSAATSGLPLGDLNWFPGAKTEWETNHDTYVEVIEGLAGDRIEYTLSSEAQAEDGVLAGGATVLQAEGLSYYDMNAGFVKWEFEVAEAGQYDINIYLNMKGRGTSGVNLFFNDVQVHDPRGWGEYVFGNDGDNTTSNQNPDINNWTYWIVKQEELKEVIDDASLTPLYFEAGKNTMEIRASWTDNLYGGFQLIKAGTDEVVATYTGADVVEYSVATPVLEGAPWAPVWFKSVSLNGGSTTVDLSAEEDGNYVIQAAYQNYSGESTGNIIVDGTVVDTYTYESAEDSTGLSGLSTTTFPLTAGTHAIGMSGNNVNLDIISLIKKDILSGVEDNNLPNGYALEQNYPNPFNPTTTIKFSIAKSADVNLSVFNVLGQKITTLVNKEMNAGTHAIQFNAKSLASGVYFYRIEAGNFVSNKKMMLLK